jgi:hypothetical protein
MLTSISYKFRLDVDGFGWTTRWRKELSSNSVVLKATLYVSLFSLRTGLNPLQRD